MKLIYFRGHVANFGDDLNAVIWPALAPGLFDSGVASPDLAVQEAGARSEEGLLGIGTIIGMPTPGCRFLHVFSSGAGYDPLDGWTVPRRVWCVRGPLTASVLGLDPSHALTDGAVLTPLVSGLSRSASDTRPGGIGVMPHWESVLAGGWDEACVLAGMRLASPIGEPLAVVRRILGLDLLLTESLHGAILADAFGVPWVPFASNANFSVFKWTDWTMSVELSPSVAAVPPPAATAALRFGRPFPIGRLDADAAAADFHRRSAPAVPAASRDGGLRARLKRGLLSVPGAARLVPGFRPETTAAALRRAAAAEPQGSRESLRDSHADRMRSLLEQVCREVVA